jgi:hypothetical protein
MVMTRLATGAPLSAALTAVVTVLIVIVCAPASAAALPEAVDFWGMPPDALSIKPQQLTWATDVSQPNFAGTTSEGSKLQSSSWMATSASGSGALWVPKLLPPNGSKVSWTSYPVKLAYSAPETVTLGTKLSATGAPYTTVSVFGTLKVTFTAAAPTHWSRSASFHMRAYDSGKSYKGYYGFTFPT